MVGLATVRQELVRILAEGEGAVHVEAFSQWIRNDDAGLRGIVNKASLTPDQKLLPEQIAALGYGKAANLLDGAQEDLLRGEVAHFSGRRFFTAGRPLRVEVDGIALLGIAFAARELPDRAWLVELLARSGREVGDAAWSLGLISVANHVLGAGRIAAEPADLAFALSLRGFGTVTDDDVAAAWLIASQLPSGPGVDIDRLATRLAAFDGVVARSTHVRIASPGLTDLLLALRGVPRAMRHWVFENAPRTPRSKIATWHIENEYHVQALLWTILAPIFPDLEDEENLPSVGHKRPRVDLAVPSIRTLIEVKFMRGGSQSDFAKVIEEVAADASLYLSASIPYDRIVAFVWDDSAHSEQHQELQSGLERIKGVEAAVVVSRPGRMARSN